MENKSKELEVAIEAALEAGKILEKYFDTNIEKGIKTEDGSTTILADKESEAVIIKTITEAFPEHAILGEESGHSKNSSNFTWHIDPLDGTTNFANGLPLFAISIALEHQGNIIASVVYNPVTNDLFYAEKGKGAYHNDKKISVSKENEKTGTVTFSSSRKKEEKRLNRHLMLNLAEKVGYIRYLGCAALELAYVAKGATEGMFFLNLKTYDFAGGVLLVEEAGGKITNLLGEKWVFPENYFIVSNGVFHDLLVEEVKIQKASLNL